MRLSVERLTDEDVAWLAELYAGLAEDGQTAPRWWVWCVECADALRSEVARRRVERAIDRDPLGYYWHGRL